MAPEGAAALAFPPVSVAFVPHFVGLCRAFAAFPLAFTKCGELGE